MAIQIRRGTDAEWESNKSNIVAGEPAVAMDTERMFVGTGSGTYMELANLDVLADAFDSSASYEVGDFVAYHGKVYKCNTDHSGAWNASDFDEVVLADALDALGDDVYTKDEADALLALKADASDVNSALALKADKSDTYTKTEVNTALALKADKSDTYTKAQVDTALGLKSDKADTYTKEQVDAIAEQIIRETEYSNFEMKSVSGDFIHITDGAGLIPVKDLKIGIDAVQDLHGYDAPWVGGAGKNVLPLTVENLKAENTAGTWNGNAYTLNDVTFTLQTDAANNVIGINVNGTASTVPTFYLVRKDANLASLLDGKSVALNGSPDGSSQATYGMQGYRVVNQSTHAYNDATFTFNAEVNSYFFAIYVASGQTANNKVFKPMLRLASVADDSFAPYANICPISGLTGAKVSVQGVNILDTEKLERFIPKGGGNHYGVIFTKAGTYAINAYVVPSNNRYIYANIKNADGTWGETDYYIVRAKTITPAIITIAAGQELYLYNASGDGSTDSKAKFVELQVQVAVGDTQPNEFHPYNGNTYSVTWQTEAGTVYGGTLDVTTGLLTINKAIFDLGLLSWQVFNGGTDPSKKRMFTGSLYGICAGAPSGADVSDIMCSCYQPMSTNYSYSDTRDGIALATSGNLYVNDATYESATEPDAFVASVTGQTLVAPLVTPQTYQLTPTEVLTLLGENNIFADTGAVEELIYRISNQ